MNAINSRDHGRETSELLPDVIEHLKEGGLLIHPTETVYGIGGLVGGPATGRLREVKERQEDGFVVLIPTSAMVAELLSAQALSLAQAFWPGPLTMVLDDSKHIFPTGVKARDGSVAVRVCGNPLTAQLLTDTGEAMTSTSANRPGGKPPNVYHEAASFAAHLGLEASGIDGGQLPGGPPSTLVDARDDAMNVLRLGSVSVEALHEVLGSGPLAPGRP